ncbi:HTH-type transcriptional activator AllS [Pseudovibrio sp. Ad5]|uniref:LysR family transcriptional regulator n=1 Tax=Pseudovibrio sp. Ad5 TaxID=989436 RepID=UPI0007AE6220|nr:LysR family transcriptional regulator [Pseudovibrio sp. Ad5]KZK88760.1 HTH-type transcriptional activator AllS [Pseudovibrio sp. Ad5]
MTYEQLVVLHAIVTEGTFRGAADRLHKSQSAISHMLKKLEAEIDMVLLSREAYRPKLTPAGEVFYRQAIRVMQQMNELGSLAKTLNAIQEAEVSLAIAATLPLQRVLEVIGHVRAKFPATHIHLSRESMSGPIERLLHDRADIIIASMDGVPVEQVEAVSFADVTILPVAHPAFEPAQSKHMKTIAEMQTYTQIIVADSGSGALSQSRDLLPGGLRWTVTDFAAKKEILQAKLGWGGIPEHMIIEELARGELVQLNVEGFQPRQSRLFQIRKRDRDVGVVAQAIWDDLMGTES